MSFRIKKISSQKDIDIFHELPFSIHENNSHYRPPFRFEVEKVFDANENERLQRGAEIERFLVFEDEHAVGRFALFTDPEKDEKYDPRLGGMGFLDFFERKGIFENIHHFSKKWFREREYKGYRGPVNLGENDRYWGILKKEFNTPNVYGMLYHETYASEMIESETDARKFDDLFMYRLTIEDKIPERMRKIISRLENNPDIHIRPVDKKNLERDGELIRTIYNNAFFNQVVKEREEEFVGISRETIRQMIKKLKPVLMPETSPIIFVKGRPASFLVSVPDLNEISVKTGGYLKWWQLPLLWRFTHRVSTLRPLAFGTDPEFRGKGLEALAFLKGVEWTRKHYPNIVESQGGFVSEKNWIMRRSLEALGCTISKEYRVYKWEW